MGGTKKGKRHCAGQGRLGLCGAELARNAERRRHQRRAGGRGFALERRPCGMETTFVATWGGEGPVIATGEYDALPALHQQAGRAEAPLCEARQAMAAGTTCWARAALPQPWR
ncbi:MAG: hypothetical protein ACLSWY_07905 [Ruthenibacterium lactatiformans]